MVCLKIINSSEGAKIMIKLRILKEANNVPPPTTPAEPAASPAVEQPAAKQQTPEEMARAAFPILQKMVTDQLIPAIQKAIQGEFAKTKKAPKVTPQKTTQPANQPVQSTQTPVKNKNQVKPNSSPADQAPDGP